MAPENVDKLELSIRLNRIVQVIMIIGSLATAIIWSNKQVSNIMNAIRDNAKANEEIRLEVADIKTKLDKQGERLEVLWYKQTESHERR